MPTGRWARILKCLLSKLFDFAAVAMAPGPCRSETHTDQMDRTVVPSSTAALALHIAHASSHDPSHSHKGGNQDRALVLTIRGASVVHGAMFRNGRWSFRFRWDGSFRAGSKSHSPVLEVLRKNCVLGAIESLARTITPHQVRLESGTDPADSVCCVSGVQKARATYEALVGARPTRSPCLRRRTCRQANHSCSGAQPPSLRW